MAAAMKRFTISITKDLEQELNSVKQESSESMNEMIRDLITRGLENVQAEKSEPPAGGGK